MEEMGTPLSVSQHKTCCALLSLVSQSMFILYFCKELFFSFLCFIFFQLKFTCSSHFQSSLYALVVYKEFLCSPIPCQPVYVYSLLLQRAFHFFPVFHFFLVKVYMQQSFPKQFIRISCLQRIFERSKMTFEPDFSSQCLSFMSFRSVTRP